MRIACASLIKVDVFLAPDRPFDRSKAQRARPGQITASNPRSFQLTPPEDIILQKIEWYAMGGRFSEGQWNDAQGVLKVHGSALDLDYMRRWSMSLGVAELLEMESVHSRLDTDYFALGSVERR